jgi:enoyl-CoA hydratase/carnithine racemase
MAVQPKRKSPALSAGAIEASREGGCVIVTLVRPPHNRINAAMASRLIYLVEEAEDDDSIHALALVGTESAFCAGFDSDVDPALVESLAALAKPTLAIINGDALDEGLELALATDLRLAIANAKFALRQLTRGYLPRFGGTQRLPRLIGAGPALKMLLTGDAIDAREAMRLRMLTYLAPNAAALKKSASQLLAVLDGRGPVAARLAKEAFLKGYDMTLGQGIRLEEDLYALLQTTVDRAEGVKAFMEKRKPLFKGA